MIRTIWRIYQLIRNGDDPMYPTEAKIRHIEESQRIERSLRELNHLPEGHDERRDRTGSV